MSPRCANCAEFGGPRCSIYHSLMVTASDTSRRRVGLPGRLAGGVAAVALAVLALACAGTALEMLGPECTSLGCEVIGASPSVTVYQYIEAALTLVSTFGALECGYMAITADFLKQRRGVYAWTAALLACFVLLFVLLSFA